MQADRQLVGPPVELGVGQPTVDADDGVPGGESLGDRVELLGDGADAPDSRSPVPLYGVCRKGRQPSRPVDWCSSAATHVAQSAEVAGAGGDLDQVGPPGEQPGRQVRQVPLGCLHDRPWR